MDKYELVNKELLSVEEKKLYSTGIIFLIFVQSIIYIGRMCIVVGRRLTFWEIILCIIKNKRDMVRKEEE